MERIIQKAIKLNPELSPGHMDLAIINITRAMELLGIDLSDEGRRETPARIAKTWVEFNLGANVDPYAIFDSKFKAPSTDEAIEIANIPFSSVCEHHFMPFFGTVNISYIPGDYIAGLSKFNRVVEVLSNKPQTQEYLTHELANVIKHALNAKYVSISISASHTCVSCRGAKSNSITNTTAVLGGE